ncbi:MAG TPA: hypothetical protein VGC66_07175 [Pyrinomonadaceae bacterium]|jgi:hypothetical protein
MFRLKLILPLLFIAVLFAPHAVIKDSASARSSMPLNSIKPASLCTATEQVVWSCVMVKDRKLVSVCSSKDLDKSGGYVQYRFGQSGKVELEFPRDRANTQSAFKYSRYTRPLVTYLKLEFVNNGITYTISDDYNSEEKPSMRDAAITVKPSGGAAAETRLKCRLPIKGSLMKLEDVVQREDY